MRTPGHSGSHFPGSAGSNEQLIRMNHESFGPGLFNSRRAKWLTYGAGTVLWFLICFQIFVDVYVLAVR